MSTVTLDSTRPRVAELAISGQEEVVARASLLARQAGSRQSPCAADCWGTGRAAERVPTVLRAFAAVLSEAPANGGTAALENLVAEEIGRGCTVSCLVGTISLVQRALRQLAGEQWPDAEEASQARNVIADSADLLRIRVAELCHEIQTAALSRSERSYRALVERASDAVLVFDTGSGDILWANQAAALLTGFTREELATTAIGALLALGDSEADDEFMERLLGGPPERLRERILRRKNGERSPVDITGSQVEFGERRAMAVIVRDSSERKELERTLARHAAELQSAVDAQVQELQRIKELNERIVESLPSRLILLDEELKVVHANGAYCRQRGVTLDDVRGRPLADVFPASLMQEAGLEAAIWETLRTGRTKSWTGLRVATEDGHPGRVLNVRLNRVGRERTRMLLVAMDDVTEDRRRVYELSMLSQITQAMQGVLSLDRLLHATLTCVTAGPAVGLGFNRAFLLLLDEGCGALVGRYAVGPESAERAHEIWREVAERPRTLDDFLGEYDRIGETPPPILDVVKHLYIPMGRQDDVLVRAATQRRPYHVTDAENDPRVSPTFRELYRADEFVVAPLVAKDRTLGVVIADNAFSRKAIGPLDVALLTRFANQAALALDSAHAHQELIDRAEELAEANRQLQEAHERLVAAERLAAVGEITAHVAHEIRTPLAIIGGFARRVQRHAEDADRCKRNADIIVEETDRLENILRNTLDFTRPGHPRLAEHDVAELLEDIRVLAAEVIEAEPINLVIGCPEDMPPVTVDGDQVKQALLNLVKNAIQAMPRGGELKIEAGVEADRLRLRVSDGGDGMEPEVMDSIFDAFFTTKSGGSGLGLAITRAIVQDHHGEIEVTSQVGVGTTFTIRLPLQPPDESPDADLQAVAERRG